MTGIGLGKLAFLYAREVREFLADDFAEEDVVAVMLRFENDKDDVVRRALRDCIALGRELSNLEDVLRLSRPTAAILSYPSTTLNSKWEAIRRRNSPASELVAELFNTSVDPLDTWGFNHTP